MDIPVTNLRPAIEATRKLWEANFNRLFALSHFILGEQVREFESAFARATGARHAAGTGNGTDAISLCLRDAGIRSGVLTSALTAPFTGVAILAAGARPVFADINPETLQMDPGDAGNRLRKDTAAILAVHLYGQPCDIARIAQVARGKRRLLIQDACQAHGARFEGRALTSFSRYVAYSFYPTKNLGALGDGGAVTTNSPAIDRRLRMLRDGGRQNGKQVSTIAGINSRLDEMQCCFLSAFLPQLAAWNEDRRRTALLYDHALRDCPGVRLVKRTPDSVHHLYVIRAKRRERLREFLAARGIGAAVHYPVPLHLNPAFRECRQKRGDLPHAERAAREVLSLPLWPYLGEAQASRVADGIRAFYSQGR